MNHHHYASLIKALIRGRSLMHKLFRLFNWALNDPSDGTEVACTTKIKPSIGIDCLRNVLLTQRDVSLDGQTNHAVVQSAFRVHINQHDLICFHQTSLWTLHELVLKWDLGQIWQGHSSVSLPKRSLEWPQLNSSGCEQGDHILAYNMNIILAQKPQTRPWQEITCSPNINGK